MVNRHLDNGVPWGGSTRAKAPPGRDPGGSHKPTYNPRIPPRANTQSNQGNQHANEFANIVSDAPVIKDTTPTYTETFGSGYTPWTTSREDQFLSAFGGLNYDWADPDDSRTDFLKFDINGKPIRGGPDNRLWDPFVKGYDPETGKERRLSFDEWNTMLDYGEFDQGTTGNYSGYGGGGGGGGWGDSWGAGGGGGGGGGYGYAEEDFTPRGNPNEAWGQQNPLQQAMISIHGGQGFQQGFARGGIVSLVA